MRSSPLLVSRLFSASYVSPLVTKAFQMFSPAHIWLNPGCRLKAQWLEEVQPALAVMVEAARNLREIYRKTWAVDQ